MPMFKIYVGNLDPRVKIEQVRELFSPFVTIEDAVLVADTKTGKGKGFAIIMVRDPEIGRAAVKATQGKRLLGKTLTINEVMKKGQAAKVAKETRQGPFGPHFNRQGGGRAGSFGGRGGGSVRRGVNRGPRGGSGFAGGSNGPSPGMGGGSSGSFGSRGAPGPGFGGGAYGSRPPMQRPAEGGFRSPPPAGPGGPSHGGPSHGAPSPRANPQRNSDEDSRPSA